MSNDPNKDDRLLEYQRKKALGLEILRKSAQSAYSRALNEKKLGHDDLALQWMRRAYHLNRDNAGIKFDLIMLYFKQQDYDRAFDLLSSLMQKCDFYEGWITLIMVQVLRKSFEDGILKLQYFLSHYSPNKGNWSLLTGLLRKAGSKIGCCGISSSSQELWIESFSVGQISVYFDNEPYAETIKARLPLPKGWHLKREIRIEQNGIALVGSPISVSSICKIEGGVEFKDNKVTGWLWYPAEPKLIPRLMIYDENEKKFGEIEVTQEMEVISLKRPLFRGRCFSFSIEDLPVGTLFFKDQYGTNLMGSPFNPSLEKEGMDFLISLPMLIRQKKNLNNYPIPSFIPIKADYRGEKPESSPERGKDIVVVIPIFKGKDTTLTCLKTVLETIPETVKIQLVNDASPDQDLCMALEFLQSHKQIFYIRHDKNKGFPAAVNSGMRAWQDHDIILLNSDTLVGKGWIECLQQAAYKEETIGTVTPLSNNAGVFSYPCHDKENPAISLKEINNFTKYAGTVNAGQGIEIPTANGFCMYIRHDCLKQTGLFNEDLFVQGYGEENDFCMRARHLGWKHILAMDVFVGHEGSVSFQGSRDFLIERNTRILNQLYPDYDLLIQTYLRQDEALALRRKIDMQRLKEINAKSKKEGNPYRYALFIMHRYQGGVGKAVQERMTRIRSKGIIPIVIQPSLLQDGCELEIKFQSVPAMQQGIQWLFPNLVFHLPKEYPLLIHFLRKINIELIEIHHLLGHHDLIRCLPKDLKMDYDMFVHDYYVFCPRIALLNGAKEYCNDPVDWRSCQSCIDSQQLEEQGESPVKIQEWVLRSQQELEKARNVYVPSQDCYVRILKHFPALTNIYVQPLEDDKPELSLAQIAYFSQISQRKGEQTLQKKTKRKRFRICIIGAINIEKGLGKIHSLLYDIEKRDLPLEFVLVGKTRNDELLMQSDRIFITGDYQDEEGVSLVSEQHADIAFLPSIFPETWCYTLSIAWRAGLKTVAYDIGAIAERIKNTKRGWIIPSDVTIEQQNDFLLRKCKENYIKLS